MTSKNASRHLGIALLSLIALFLVGCSGDSSGSGPAGYLTEDGRMKVPARDSVTYENETIKQNATMTIKRIVFESAGRDVYGLVIIPESERELPGLVLIPGAGVSKEAEQATAEDIARLGYVVLTYDQQGVGETAGSIRSLEEDFAAYQEGRVAVQHLFIADALASADVLTTLPETDGRVIMSGESLGGVIAILAGSIEERLKGVVAISAAGLHIQDEIKSEKDRFVKSLDADNYVPHISPRPFVMIHSIYDRNVPIDSAQVTYREANQPKAFIVINQSDCGHGYCSTMLPAVNASLDYVANLPMQG